MRHARLARQARSGVLNDATAILLMPFDKKEPESATILFRLMLEAFAF